MSPLFKRIAVSNMVVLLVVAGTLRLFIRQEPAHVISGYAALMALAVLALFFANLVGAMVAATGQRTVWVLSALLVLLIGFGVCAAGVQSIPRVQEIP